MAPTKNIASKKIQFQKSPPDNKNPMDGTRPLYGPPFTQRPMSKPAHHDRPSHIRHKPTMGDHSQKTLVKPINLMPTRGTEVYRNHGGTFWCVLLVVIVIGLFVYMIFAVITKASREDPPSDEDEGIELQVAEEIEDQYEWLEELEAGEAQLVPLLLAQPDEESTAKAPF